MARVRRGICFTVSVGLVTLACAVASDHEMRQEKERRVQQQLGLDPPFRLLGIAFLDDGGTGVASIAAHDDTIQVWEDDSLFVSGPTEFGKIAQPIPRHVWLGAHPRSQGSRELAYSSPAESAVVDLLRLQVQALVSASEESALVRGERRARSNRDHDAWSVWRSKLSSTEWDVIQLRMLIGRIEWRRAGAANASP